MDIYFEDGYGRLYEKLEKGEYKSFFYEDEHGSVKHSFIMRKIPNTEWFDILTPYGYGGPLIIKLSGDKRKLVENFFYQFSLFIQRERIVSEFIRFHPIINNAHDFGVCYDIIYDRHTIGTNLEVYDNPVNEEFSKHCKKNIKQALNKNISFQVAKDAAGIERFKKVYYSTMERNIASEYYYFNDEYFDNLFNKFKEQILIIEIIYEGKTIAAELCLLSDGVIHVHLSGTLTEYLYLSPAYILKYATVVWGKEKGYKLVHYGGGRSNREDDGLYLFKQQFGIHTKFDFYVGKKIWMPEIYKELTEKHLFKEKIIHDAEFFPAYRG